MVIPGLGFRWCWTQEGKELTSIAVRTDSDRVTLSYRYRRNDGQLWKVTEYSVRVEWTRCNYGGARAWFRCPARGCGRRVAILYLGGEVFACRHCHQLAYECQREQAHHRALRRAQAIRQRLGWTGNICVPFPRKPRYMHWNTYERLLSVHREAYASSLPPNLRRLIGMAPKAFQLNRLGQKNSVPAASQNELRVQPKSTVQRER